MARVYNTMEYCVNELLSYLTLYRELIINKQYDSHYINQATELLNKITQLEEIVQSNGNFSNFDFENMKRNFASVFHPDRFRIKLEYIEDPDEIFGKALNSFNEINELNRKKSNSQFKYNSTTGDSYRANAPRNNSYNQYGQRPNSSYRPTGNTSTNTTNNNGNNGDKNDSDLDYEYNEPLPYILQFISDKFNAIFRDIPSSERDYQNILFRLCKRVDNLQRKKNLLTEAIISIQRRQRDNKNTWQNNVKDEEIDKLYYEKLYSLKDILDRKKQMFHQAENNRNKRYEVLLPDIYGRFERWKTESMVYINQYKRLIDNFHYCMTQLTQDDYKPLLKDIEQMREFIERNYMDPDFTFRQIEKKVLQEDQQYCRLENDLIRAKKGYLKAEQRFQFVLKNQEQCKKDIRDRITEEYSEKSQEDADRLKSVARKKQRIQDSLDDAINQRDEFIKKYGPSYSNSHTKS